MELRRATSGGSVTAAVTVLALLFLFLPLAVVVLFSFHSTASLSIPFQGFSLRWYRDVLGSDEFRAAVENSAIVATATSALTLLIGTLAAYGVSRAPARWRGALTLLFFLPITLPGLFLGIALLVFFARLNLDLSLATVTAAHFVYVFPFFFLVARTAFDRMDVALEEAAKDLGATPTHVFRRVTLPQVWPVLVGATALAFALSFDEFVMTFFVIGSDSTLPLFIWSSIRRHVDPSINTVSTLLMTVTLLLSLVAFLFALPSERSGRAALAEEPEGEDLLVRQR